MAHGLFIETFYGGSHKAFADGLIEHSQHSFQLLTLPGDEWRKRMRRGALELAAQANGIAGPLDFILATDMVDLATLLAATRGRFGGVPVLLYMHENQFTYPRLRGTKFNSWFGQINYQSALVADRVAFNSAFHRESFLDALGTLEREPNNWLLPGSRHTIAAKSAVLPVGVDFAQIDANASPRPEGPPIVLWNHRWEFDKAPDMFVRVLRRLRDEGIAFRVAVAGDPGPNPHPALATIPGEFGGMVYHHGFAADQAAYARLLWESSINLSTTRHEFFGISTVEALRTGCFPILPSGFSYPDLVPPTLYEDCLFTSEEDCVRLLRRAIISPPAPAIRDSLRASTERWTWSRVAGQWDEAVDGLLVGP